MRRWWGMPPWWSTAFALTTLTWLGTDDIDLDQGERRRRKRPTNFHPLGYRRGVAVVILMAAAITYTVWVAFFAIGLIIAWVLLDVYVLNPHLRARPVPLTRVSCWTQDGYCCSCRGVSGTEAMSHIAGIPFQCADDCPAPIDWDELTSGD